MVRRTVVLLLSSFDAIPQGARVGIFPLHLDPPTIYHQEIFRALVGDGMGSKWGAASPEAKEEAARLTAIPTVGKGGSTSALSREELVNNLREAVFSSEFAPFDHLIVLPNTRFPITIQQARHLAAMATLSCKNLAGNKLDVDEVERDTQAALQLAMNTFPGEGVESNSGSNPLQGIPYLQHTRRRTRSVAQVLASSTLLTPAEVAQWKGPHSSTGIEPIVVEGDDQIDDSYFRPSLSPTPDYNGGFNDTTRPSSPSAPPNYVPEVAGTARRRNPKEPGTASANHHANIYRRVHMELYSLEHPDVHMPIVQRLVTRFPNATIVHWLPNVFETHQWKGFSKLFEQVPFLLLRPRGFHFGASTTMAHFENRQESTEAKWARPSDPSQLALPSETAAKRKRSEVKGISREEGKIAVQQMAEALQASKYLHPKGGVSSATDDKDSPSSPGPYTTRLSHRSTQPRPTPPATPIPATWAAAASAATTGSPAADLTLLEGIAKALHTGALDEAKKKAYRVPRPEKLEIIEVDRLSGVRVRQLLWDRGSADVVQDSDGTVRSKGPRSGRGQPSPVLGEAQSHSSTRSKGGPATVVPDDGSSIIPHAVLRYMNSHGLYRDFRKGDSAGMDTLVMSGPHAAGAAGGASASATGSNSGGAGRSPSLAFHPTVAFSSVIPRLELHYDPLNRAAREFYEMLRPYEVRPGKEPDLIVPIGGDGFMMHCIRRQWERFIPFFGVNAGHVGFLLNDNGTLEELFTAPLRLHHMSMLYVQAETEVEEDAQPAYVEISPTPSNQTPETPPEAPADAAVSGSVLARNVAKIQAEMAAASTPTPTPPQHGPKRHIIQRREELAFNDAWVERSGGQSALIRLLINGSERIRAVRGDGVLVSTAAGSTAYAQALGASPFPVDVPLLQLVGSNVVSPPRWRPVHLSQDDTVEFQVIDSFKRPCRGFVDSVDIGNVTKFKIKTSRVASVQLAFCSSCDLQHKLYQLQFPKGF